MAEQNLPNHLVFHGNGGSFPPHGMITLSDHGPAVVVATWIMMCLMVLAFVARLGMRHLLDRDSAAIGLACVGYLDLLVDYSFSIVLNVNRLIRV